MDKIHPLVLFVTLFSFASCEKETVVKDDPALVKYFGTWEFKEMKDGSHWTYIPTPNGTQVVFSESETTLWQGIGTVSMGREAGELKIMMNGNYTITYYATVDQQGNLICSGECANIPYVQSGAPGSSPSGNHQITDSTFNIHLGYESAGTGSSYSFYITGEKL